MMGSQSLLHVGALSVRLSEGFPVLMPVCFVRSSCVKLSCVQWSVSGGQEQIGCRSVHLGCVSGVLSGIHVL